MTNPVLGFYEPLADYYHLIFDDWDRAVWRQAAILGPLLTAAAAKPLLTILDCACGIGTQAIGLAAAGHRVTATDLSAAEVNRARVNSEQLSLVTERLSLEIDFHVADMTSLAEISKTDFDTAIVMDNALPHLEALQLRAAFRAIASKLSPQGIFMASIRDYDGLVLDKPDMLPPAFYGAKGNRRIVHQVWDWKDESSYVLHLYITIEADGRWHTHHFVSEYRCVLREEISAALGLEWFEDIRWLMPEQSGYYQPIVMARRR
jgi:glycine/sarcosine N-methyltransferase